MTIGTTSDSLSGKYLTFQVGGEHYGLPILAVQEIIGLIPVTKMPQAPAYVRGVINLRGRIIPVLDLHAKFGLAPQADTERTCIVVVQVGCQARALTVGAVVDEVSEVLDIAHEQIENPPVFGGFETDFMLGMAKVGTKVVMLLDTEKVLSRSETDQVNEVASLS